jgi:hypothetical protein
MIEKLKKQLLPLKGSQRTKFLRDIKSYVYVYCEITDENKRVPIYIGKGKSDTSPIIVRMVQFFFDVNNYMLCKAVKLF